MTVYECPWDVITKCGVPLQVSVVGDTVNVSGQSNCTPVKVPECKLSDDLGVLFERSSFSDVTLCLGGRQFSAHKAVLAGILFSRSNFNIQLIQPYLKALIYIHLYSFTFCSSHILEIYNTYHHVCMINKYSLIKANKYMNWYFFHVYIYSTISGVQCNVWTWNGGKQKSMYWLIFKMLFFLLYSYSAFSRCVCKILPYYKSEIYM